MSGMTTEQQKQAYRKLEQRRIELESEYTKFEPKSADGIRVSGQLKEIKQKLKDTISKAFSGKTLPERGGDQAWNDIRTRLAKFGANKSYLNYFDSVDARMKNTSGLMAFIVNTLSQQKSVYEDGSHLTEYQLLEDSLQYYLNNLRDIRFKDTNGQSPSDVTGETSVVPGNYSRIERMDMYESLSNMAGGAIGFKGEMAAMYGQNKEYMKGGLVTGTVRSTANFLKTLVDASLRQVGIKEDTTSAMLAAAGIMVGGNILLGSGTSGALPGPTASEIAAASSATAAGGTPVMTSAGTGVTSGMSGGELGAEWARGGMVMGGNDISDIYWNYKYGDFDRAFNPILKQGQAELSLLGKYIAESQSSKVVYTDAIKNNIANVVSSETAAYQYSGDKRDQLLNEIDDSKKSIANEIGQLKNAADSKTLMDAYNKDAGWIQNKTQFEAKNILANGKVYEAKLKEWKEKLTAHKVFEAPFELSKDALSLSEVDFAKKIKTYDKQIDATVLGNDLKVVGYNAEVVSKAKELFMTDGIGIKSFDSLVDLMKKGEIDSDDNLSALYKLEDVSSQYKSDQAYKTEQRNILRYVKNGDEILLKQLSKSNQQKYKALREHIKKSEATLDNYEKVIDRKTGKANFINKLTGKAASDKVLSNLAMTADYEINGKRVSEIIPSFHRNSATIQEVSDMRHAIASRHETGTGFGAERQYHIAQKKREQDHTKWMTTARLVNSRIERAYSRGENARKVYDDVVQGLKETKQDFGGFDTFYSDNYGRPSHKLKAIDTMIKEKLMKKPIRRTEGTNAEPYSSFKEATSGAKNAVTGLVKRAKDVAEIPYNALTNRKY